MEKDKSPTDARNQTESSSTLVPKLVIAWLWAGIPLIWGVTQTVSKALALFK